jgi:hypothetical protein
MEEPTNEHTGPNPLEQLAERVKIHVEKCELPLAIGLLLRADAKGLAKYARVSYDRTRKPEAAVKTNRIERAILRNPQMTDANLARLLLCERSAVLRARRNIAPDGAR